MRKAVLAAIIGAILVASIAISYFAIGPQESTFTLNVLPDAIRGDAIAGQLVVLLVTINDNGSGQNGGADKATISATASNSAILVQPEAIDPGQVAEVDVIPDVSAVGSNVSVTIKAERGGSVQSHTMEFAVTPGEDFLGPYAQQLRELFVQWLQENDLGLGITNQTQWEGTIVSPNWLVVSHYLFFSKDWEMHVYWHIMIPPYDWAKIDLRHRFNETIPSLSFEISSLNASLPPQQITPPDSVWR